MIGILHFSDIHIKEKDEDISYMCEEINNAIESNLEELESILIIISGDIAAHGKEEQYNNAYVFLEELREDLKSRTKLNVYYFVIPGNHDCNFSKNQDLRNEIINLILKDKNSINQAFIKQCCTLQEEFFSFKNALEEDGLETLFEDELINIKKLTTKKENIYIIGMNTAWISKIEEKVGSMFFPIQKYIDKIEEYNDGIIISTFHHPSKWSHPDDSNDFDREIERLSDFILTGHEHYCDQFEKRSDSSNVVYIKAHALQQYENSFFRSGFSFINIDLEEKKYKYLEFDYRNPKYNLVNNPEWISYEEMFHKKSNLIKLDKEQRIFLDDIGMNLNHPKKSTLKLNDVFIYPEMQLRNINEEKSELLDIIISSKEFFKSQFNKSVIIYGDDKSGKTALARKLYSDFFEDNYLPIYLDCALLKRSNLYNVEKLIDKYFSKQYDLKNEESYVNDIALEKKIIIFDNLESLDGSKTNKYKFLKEIMQKGIKVICFCKTLFSLEDILCENEEARLDLDLDEYELKKFRHRMRYNLIHKWNTIGERNNIYDDEFIVEDTEKARKINTIIGKNYIPSVPFYILIILQAFETGNEHNFSSSSYGYYYEYLILETLNKISNINGEIDAINNFMIELAKSFYFQGINYIDELEIKKFHYEFCEKYGFTGITKKIGDFEEFIYNLCNNNILVKINNNYEFTYKYIYYYYIGKYFSNNIDRDEIHKEVSSMIDKLYIEEYANIIVFLVHLNKSSFILEKLMNVSNNLFKYNKCIKLEDDAEFINKLQDKLPEMIIKNEVAPTEHREKELRIKDEMERNQELEEKKATKEEVYDSNEDNDDSNEKLEEIKQLNLAFKSMEISGQILRNYWGSLTAITKKEIGTELYSVGLRSLSEIYKMLEGAEENLSLVIKNSLSKKYDLENKEIDKETLEKQTKRMVFLFSAYFTNSIVSKITDCIGDRNLLKTYEDIYSELSYNSVKLINLNIKLEYYSGTFPFNEVKELLEENKRNILVTFLIKHMVREFIYMNNISKKDKVKIAELIQVPIAGINLSKMKQIEINKKE
ncbi:TPA: hypothetical protein I9065_000890 [Clostridium perfringens]|uniref:STAND family AAA ATPase n=1 Tax=Clostridium perfringens TaxID=1502 RepID=UPI001A25F5BC|nr:hypothetical protein [Clostridium perfringens]